MSHNVTRILYDNLTAIVFIVYPGNFQLCSHKTAEMAGDFVPESELNLKGWQKHFNSYTLRGRFNVSASVICVVFFFLGGGGICNIIFIMRY